MGMLEPWLGTPDHVILLAWDLRPVAEFYFHEYCPKNHETYVFEDIDHDKSGHFPQKVWEIVENMVKYPLATC